MTIHSDSYLVTEPGMTSLHLWQWLSERELDEAEDHFGPSAFVVRPVTDVLEDWLAASLPGRDPSDVLTRTIILDRLLGAVDPPQGPFERGESGAGDVTLIDLCRQAVARLARLGRLRILGAPGIVLRNERRMILATVRNLLAVTAAQIPLQDEGAVQSASITVVGLGETLAPEQSLAASMG